MANSSRKAKKAELERQEQTEREIIGICFIALALFLAAGIYTDMVGVIGNAAKNLTFGLFGIAGYAAPFILAGLGILSIAMSKSPASISTLWLIVGGVVCLLVIIHTATRGEITVDKVTAYYSDAYMYGKLYCKGGGLLGALLAYPSMKLLGTAGTYIFFGAAVFIVFLVATKLSIRTLGQKVGSGIRNGVESVSEKVQQVHARDMAERQARYDYEHAFDGLEQIYPPKPRKRRGNGKELYTETLEKNERSLPYPSLRSLRAGRMTTAILCAAGKTICETIGTAIFHSCHRMENCQSARTTAILLIYFPGWTMAS